MKRKFKNTSDPFIAFIAVLLVVLSTAVSCGSPPYTARVVDAETGEPVEGAVYLAVWWKEVSGKKAWFEGTSIEMAKFVEGYTDEKGSIQVPRFWLKYPFARERTLTVYKPGYVMWNQEYIFPDSRKRKDFNSRNREIKMQKWKSEYLYHHHSMLIIDALRGQIRADQYIKGKQILYKTYIDHEEELYRRERMIRGEKQDD